MSFLKAPEANAHNRWRGRKGGKKEGRKEEKNETFILSTLRKLEIHNQGVSETELPLRALGKNPFLLLLTSNGCQISWHSSASSSTTPVSAPIVSWPSSLHRTGFCVISSF